MMMAVRSLVLRSDETLTDREDYLRVHAMTPYTYTYTHQVSTLFDSDVEFAEAPRNSAAATSRLMVE
jgi:hypothetical protein